MNTRARSTPETIARGLGWVSLCIGVAELLVPRRMTRAVGLRGQEDLFAAYGLREIATGIGLLTAKDPTPWVWGRVGGDVLDLASLGQAADPRNPRRPMAIGAMVAVAGITALDFACAWWLSALRSVGRQPARDYSDRSGLPRAPAEMRGAARDALTPKDMRGPDAMRPYTLH